MTYDVKFAWMCQNDDARGTGIAQLRYHCGKQGSVMHTLLHTRPALAVNHVSVQESRAASLRYVQKYTM